MNSNRSSRLVVISAVLLAAVAVGGVAALSADVPETARTGTQTNATITLNQSDLYDRYDSWELHGRTQLRNATWTVVGYNAADREVTRVTYPQDGGNGTTFVHPVNIEKDVVRIEIRVRGTVPEADTINFTFSPRQSITVAKLVQVKGSNRRTLATFETHPYTNASKRARQAILNAREVVEGSGSKSAKRTLENAITLYNAEKFQEAIETAKQAKQTAKGAMQRSQLIRTALYVVVALIVLGGIAGGAWWYLKNRRASRL